MSILIIFLVEPVTDRNHWIIYIHPHSKTTHFVLHLLHRVESHSNQRDQHKDRGGDPHQPGGDRSERLLHQVPDFPPGRPEGHAVKKLLVLLHLHLEDTGQKYYRAETRGMVVSLGKEEPE